MNQLRMDTSNFTRPNKLLKRRCNNVFAATIIPGFQQVWVSLNQHTTMLSPHHYCILFSYTICITITQWQKVFQKSTNVKKIAIWRNTRRQSFPKMSATVATMNLWQITNPRGSVKIDRDFLWSIMFVISSTEVKTNRYWRSKEV